MTGKVLPDFPYGAVYFRKTNPPEPDWARDYRVAAQDGHNTFRHWFMWSAIELAPGEDDWADYDRQLDLAAAHGIKTIIAEMVSAAPEWAFRAFAHGRFVRRDGSVVTSGYSPSAATGGFPGLCLDNADVRSAAGDFLRRLARRYRDHPGLGGYDIWNECNYPADTCYCPATVDAFRGWLKGRYAGPREVGRAWHRYSLADWADIEPPREVAGAYPDQLDWLRFRLDNAYELMRWRAELIRGIDPGHPVTAHGIAASLTRMASSGADDWRAAAEVETYGLTWGSSRHGDEPWKQIHALDLVRAAARGKPVWHAESYAGPLWMQPQVIDRPRDDGRIAAPEDIRYWNLASFATGARGLLYLRWRPLLDGPLFGAFGGYAMDGSRTERSDMVSTMARWATDPAREPLWRARPVRGDIGIVYVPETQLFAYAQQGHTGYYSRALEGAYQGFFANNIQADWVHVDHIDEYELLYLAYPVMLPQQAARRLHDWVLRGGTLISEGCPGYFGDAAHVGTRQPNLGLAEVFGADEEYVEFTPDLLDDLTFTVAGTPVRGSTFLQAYTPTTGTAVGWYPDERIAAVDNDFGAGRTRLIGTFPGAGFGYRPGPDAARFFADLLDWAGRTQHVRVGNRDLVARVQSGETGTYLWVLNPTRTGVTSTVTLSAAWAATGPVEVIRGGPDAVRSEGERSLQVRVERRDATVLRLG